MEIRELIKSDASDFRALRLRALKEYPTIFSASYEAEREWPVERFADQLPEIPGSTEAFMLGCWIDRELVASMAFFRYDWPKTMHIGRIVAVHVAAEHQGKGCGRAMAEVALKRAKILPGLTTVQLTATTTNQPAISLYESMGFEICGTTPRAMQVDGQYIDEHLMVLKLV